MPDEVAKMGATFAEHHARSSALDAYLVAGETEGTGSKIIVAATQLVRFPAEKEIPNYGQTENFFAQSFIVDPMANRDYYREFAKYFQFLSGVTPVRFGLDNSRSGVAENARVLFRTEAKCWLGTEQDLPPRPKHSTIASLESRWFGHRRSNLTVNRTQTGWSGEVAMGRLQAKDTRICSDELWMGTALAQTINLEAKV